MTHDIIRQENNYKEDKSIKPYQNILNSLELILQEYRFEMWNLTIHSQIYIIPGQNKFICLYCSKVQAEDMGSVEIQMNILWLQAGCCWQRGMR